MRADVLETVLRASSTPATLRALAEQALAYAEDAVEEDIYDAALRLLEVARRAANTLDQRDAARHISGRINAVREMQQEYGPARAAVQALVQTPDDPDASGKWGRFLCLFKGAWSKGIPFLAQGGDLALKELAGKEMARPADGRAQADLANAYLTLSQGEKNRLIRKNLGLHAKGWLEKAASLVKGQFRRSIEQRVKGIEDRLAEEENIFGARAADPTPRQQCDQLIHEGRIGCVQGKWATATQAFQKVLAMKPGDSRATTALRKIRCCQHFDAGQAALGARQYADAVREFDEALKEVPDDLTTQAALKQARNRWAFSKISG
jgi:tetratricopeptide (TPR) repeat protein